MVIMTAKVSKSKLIAISLLVFVAVILLRQKAGRPAGKRRAGGARRPVRDQDQ